MSISEFRYNKKRRHYAYIFKKIGAARKNILISSKPLMIEKKHKKNRIKTKVTINIVLYRHPNIVKRGKFYLIPKIYVDSVGSFGDIVLDKWFFDKHDKRKVKRIKRIKNRLRHHLSGKSPVLIFKHIYFYKTRCNQNNYKCFCLFSLFQQRIQV